MEKRLIADNVNILKEEVKTLHSTLVDVNTTLSSLIPELIINFDNAKNDFQSTLNDTRNDFLNTLNSTKNDFLSTLNSTSKESISLFAGYLESALQTTELKLSNISSEFVQLGQDFNATLGSVEENVKIGIST